MRLLLTIGCLACWTRAWAAFVCGLCLALPLSAGAQSGPTWRSIGPPGGTVLSMVASPLAPSVLYAGTSRNGVFMSADAGQTWSAANTGLTPTASSATRKVSALVVDTRYVYAATEAGLFYAVAGTTGNDLPNWMPVTVPVGLASALSLLTVDIASSTLLAATTAVDSSSAPAIYAMPLPTTGAAPSGSWVASPMPPATLGSAIGAVTVVPGSAVLAGVGDRVFVSSIAGAAIPLQWQDDDPFLQLHQLGVVEALHYSSDFAQVYACAGGQLLQAVNAFDPPTNAWSPLTVTPAPMVSFNCAGMASGGLAYGTASAVAVATSAGVYLSSDGSSFMATPSLGVSPAANAVAIAGGATTPMLFVGAGFGVASQSLSPLAPGATWNADNGPTSVGSSRLNNANATDIAAIGATLYAAVAAEQYADVLASTDAGATWTSTGLKNVIPDVFDVPVLAVDAANQVVYAGTGVGLYARSGGNWVQIAPASITVVNALATVGGTLFVGTDSGLYALALGAAPSSSMVTPAGFAQLRVSALHSAGGNLYAGIFDFDTEIASVSVASSATSNPMWADFAGAVGTHRILSLLWTGSALLSASRGEFVSIAQPGGSWTSASNGLSDPNNLATSLSSDGSTLYVATGSNGVFTSQPAVIAWSPYSGSGVDALPSLEVHMLRLDGGTLYAATAGGVAMVAASTGGPPTTTPPPTTPPPATPPPSGSPPSNGGGGGGAIDIESLLALLGIVAGLSVAQRGRRRSLR